ncbi:hypothetical protein CapIbe_007175 [Capra ibex]
MDLYMWRLEAFLLISVSWSSSCPSLHEALKGDHSLTFLHILHRDIHTNREAARCPPREQDQISDREVGVSSPGLENREAARCPPREHAVDSVKSYNSCVALGSRRTTNIKLFST